MSQLRFVFGACLSSMLLVACGGSQTPIGMPGGVPQNRATATQVGDGPVLDAAGSRATSELLVADYPSSTVLIYPAGVRHPAPIGKISDGVLNPYNIAVDQHGTLYVQNGNNTITEYRKDRKTVSKTLKELGSQRTCTMVVVGSDGTVYSANDEEVFEFAGGSTTPTKILPVPHASGLAVNSKNDLFVGWDAGVMGNGGVYKFKLGSDVKKVRLSNIYADSLAVDSHDNLLVGPIHIYIYKPGSKTFFRQIHNAHYPPNQFALDSHEKYLYVAIQGKTLPEVTVYDYATGELAWTVKKGLSPYASGVALRPAAPQ